MEESPEQRGYQVYTDQADESTGSDDGLPVHVKAEPIDNDYEGDEASGASEQVTPAGSELSGLAQNLNDMWTGPSIRTKIRKILDNKSLDSTSAVQKVIEELLQKNETLLSQNDAVGFKPNRRGRLPAEFSRRNEVLFPQSGHTVNFSAGQGTQGKISAAGSRSSLHESAVNVGKILRPKSPTRRCSVPEKDKTHIGLALMETPVGDKRSEDIFRVQEHEMVCALASRTKFLNPQGKIIASFDINFYWCNFCSFSTANKAQLAQHIVEHRFHCKHCRYQSFSRSDVIQHSVHTHPQFQEVAAVTQYCTLLSDYLRVQNPKTAKNLKRKLLENEEESSIEEINKPRSKMNKSSAGTDGIKTVGNETAGYDLFDMEVEDVDDNFADDPERELSRSSRILPNFAGDVPVNPSLDSQVLNSRSGKSHKRSVMKQLLSSVPSSHDQALHPQFQIITSSSSEEQLPHFASHLRSTSRNNQMTPSPSTSPAPAGLGNSSSGAGSQQIRSNLYWSCGYCSFTSKSQSEIKDHSVRQHGGKPHRYVALIKPDAGSPSPSMQSSTEKKSADNDDKNCTEENQLPSSSTNDSVDNERSRSMKNISPAVEIKQEPVDNDDDDEEIIPMKVRFPTPRSANKESCHLKCYHCNYSVRTLGPLRNHILHNHRGKSLVGVGPMNTKAFLCVRSDCQFRSSSSHTYLKHADECTPWNPSDAQVEQHLLASLTQTREMAAEAKQSSGSENLVVSSGEVAEDED